MKGKKKEKRKGERVQAALPVAVEGMPATARDVSASGIFLETDAAYALGSPVRLALDLDTPWGKVVIRSQGKIVRVEHRDEKIGVAVQFVDGVNRLDSGLHRNDEPRE
jgi:hypothetical protein